MAKPKGLGSGLDALFADNKGEFNVKQTLRTYSIEPNKHQPRKAFPESSLMQLAESIREHGMLQPIIVRQTAGGNYEIVAGERRWRAARLIGLDEVPVIVRDFDDKLCMQIALIENLQREDLNPIEEAQGYMELAENYEMSQDDIARVAGKSRSSVANVMRLLHLPKEAQNLVKSGQVSYGHAKALLAIETDDDLIVDLAKKCADDLLTVRALEKIIAEAKTAEKPEKKPQSDTYFKETEIALKEILGRKVKVNFSGKKGSLTLEFYDKDDLKALADKLSENRH